MTAIKFIHCADLHIGSPFIGVTELDADLGELLRQSTFQSYNNIVNHAIDEKVDCVLISGDIYDGENKSLQAQLKFREGLKRLSGHNIPTYIVHGNHDPLNSWSAKLELPENVFIFPGNKVQHKPLMRNGEIIAQICGISFAKSAIYDNLALKYKRTDSDVPHIGLLHANAGSNQSHEPYAPCSIEELSHIGMDYWALGHVHAFKILKDRNPAIVYSGCSQSRNARETGEKGCCLVTLETGADLEIKFIPTDVVRYTSDTVDISGLNSLDQLIAAVQAKSEEISKQMENRHTIIRMNITGRTNLHTELKRSTEIKDLLDNMRDIFSGREPRIWLEKLILNTAGTYDLNELRKGDNFIADIISIYDSLENNDEKLVEELNSKLHQLFSSWSGHKYIEELPPEELLDLSIKAKYQTLNKLVKAD